MDSPECTVPTPDIVESSLLLITLTYSAPNQLNTTLLGNIKLVERHQGPTLWANDPMTDQTISEMWSARSLGAPSFRVRLSAEATGIFHVFVNEFAASELVLTGNNSGTEISGSKLIASSGPEIDDKPKVLFGHCEVRGDQATLSEGEGFTSIAAPKSTLEEFRLVSDPGPYPVSCTTNVSGNYPWVLFWAALR